MARERTRQRRSILIRLLLPCFLLAHGLPRALLTEHVHADGERAHRHGEEAGTALVAGAVGGALSALVELASGVRAHGHSHGPARAGARTLDLVDEAFPAPGPGAAAVPAGVTTTPGGEGGPTRAERARFRARLASIGGGPARVAAGPGKSSPRPGAWRAPGEAGLRTARPAPTAHRHAASLFQSLVLSPRVETSPARRLVGRPLRLRSTFARGEPAATRARSPPFA